MQPQSSMGGPLTWQLEDLGKRIKVLEETLTQLKTLDLTLHEMQFIVQNYVERIKEGIVLIQDELVVWANKAACDILEYKLEDVINKSAIELVHPKYRQQLSARFAMVQAGDDIPARVVWPFISKTREIRYIISFSYRVMYSEKPALMALFYDVTDEQKAKDELSMKAEMLDLVSDSVYLLDLKGNIKYVNKAGCESLGYTLDEITGMNIVDINAADLREKAGIRLKIATGKKASRFKTVHVSKDGRRKPVSVSIKVIKRGGQEFILGVVREIVREEESL